MIFPDLPRTYQLNQGLDALAIEQAQAPLHMEEPEHTVDIELWFEQRGLPSTRTDPAALSGVQGPIDWLAKDAWEFYALCVGIVCWIMYWRWLA